MGVHACNLSTAEAEAGGSQFETSVAHRMRPSLKAKGSEQNEKSSLTWKLRHDENRESERNA